MLTKLENNHTKSAKRRHVLDFMRSAPFAVISTVCEDGTPHAAVVYANTDDDLTVQFYTDPNTRKFKNIQRSNQAMVVFFDAGRKTTVQISGDAQADIDGKTNKSLCRVAPYWVRMTTQKPDGSCDIFVLDL